LGTRSLCLEYSRRFGKLPGNASVALADAMGTRGPKRGGVRAMHRVRDCTFRRHVYYILHFWRSVLEKAGTTVARTYQKG
jgi:hypothetical protein